VGHLLASLAPEAAHLVKALAPRLQRTSSQGVAKGAKGGVVVDSGSGAGMGWQYWAVVEVLGKVSPVLEV
jgi:hypothetical protein